ncbi:MAG: hypothetical protein HWQ43_04905 [Nostoc sp. JL31]|nr:hypothetical protein [Nostoc sp. JL31]MBN3888524.1 hypothetical protein [Nostoc sp. JL31]
MCDRHISSRDVYDGLRLRLNPQYPKQRTDRPPKNHGLAFFPNQLR